MSDFILPDDDILEDDIYESQNSFEYEENEDEDDFSSDYNHNEWN